MKDKYDVLADKFFRELQVKFTLADAKKELAKRIRELEKKDVK